MADRLTSDMRIGGYAPGNYFCMCATCRQQFIGDKRAVTCFDCAKEQAAVAAARAQIVAWLRAEAASSKRAAKRSSSPLLGREYLHEAVVRSVIADSIETGAPQRWAAEREGEGR